LELVIIYLDSSAIFRQPRELLYRKVSLLVKLWLARPSPWNKEIKKQDLLAACFMLFFWIAHFSALKMETLRSSETSVNITGQYGALPRRR
jgi:hypothetical protein